eukprot:1551439-Amphidinium_carterae.1
MGREVSFKAVMRLEPEVCRQELGAAFCGQLEDLVSKTLPCWRNTCEDSEMADISADADIQKLLQASPPHADASTVLRPKQKLPALNSSATNTSDNCPQAPDWALLCRYGGASCKCACPCVYVREENSVYQYRS